MYDDKLAEAYKEIAALRERVAELEQSAQRAIKLWQAAHPDKSEAWPDTASLIVWLMEQLTEAKAKLAAEIKHSARLQKELAVADDTISQLVDDCIAEANNLVAFRATVAAALAELRAQWNAQYQDYVSKTDDSSWERRQELLDRMRELDAVIAKLDLAEKEQPK